MSKLFQLCAAFAAALLVSGLAANVQAELLFSDNFNTDTAPTADNSYCLNTDLNTRLSGTVGKGMTTAWARATNTAANLVEVNMTGREDSLWMYRAGSTGYQQTATAIIQQDFAAGTAGAAIANAGGFTVRYDVLDVNNGGFVSIGGSTATGTPNGSGYTGCYDASMDFTFKVDSSGNFQIWYGGTYSHTPAWYGTGFKYDAVGGSGPYVFEVRVTTDDFQQGTHAKADVYYSKTIGTPSNQLTQVDLDPNDVNGAGSMSFEWNWDANGKNYINFTHSSGTSLGYPKGTQFDDIQIAAGTDNILTGAPVVPEPSTFALLACGLFGLLAYAWRKRK